MTQTSPAANREYVAGRCVNGCGRRYSAGRIRCQECFDGQDVVLIEPIKREKVAI